MRHSDKMSLFTDSGERKYLTPEERDLFLQTAKKQGRHKRSFALMLANTGMRLSEVLSLTASSIDLSGKTAVVETLKQRKKGVFRAVPLSEEFINELVLVFEIPSRRTDYYTTAM